MNRTLKITTIIFLIQVIFWTIIWGSKFEMFPIIEAYVILLILLLKKKAAVIQLLLVLLVVLVACMECLIAHGNLMHKQQVLT